MRSVKADDTFCQHGLSSNPSHQIVGGCNEQKGEFDYFDYSIGRTKFSLGLFKWKGNKW